MLPPPAEQAAIVNYVEAEAHGLNKTIGRLEREIELLREYRTGLVFNVVTDRFDVRDAAERLPDEAMLAPSDMPEDEMDEIDPADEAAAEA